MTMDMFPLITQASPFLIYDLSLGLWQEQHNGGTSGVKTAFPSRMLTAKAVTGDCSNAYALTASICSTEL